MKPTRRQFLTTSALATSGLLLTPAAPVEKLVQMILRSVVRSAHADGGLTSKYISISMPGAPPRWCFDQFLKTRDSESITQSPMAMTNFASGQNSYQNPVYELINYKGVLVPKIWGTQVKVGGGAQRPMSQLLDNMIVFRGYGSSADGHPTNGARQTNPVPGIGSLSGYMADNSSTLFKAVQFPNLGGFSGYDSVAGTGLTVSNYLGNVNYLSTFLNPFGSRSESTGINAIRTRYADALQAANDALTQLGKADHGDFGPLAIDQQQALSKIKTGIANLNDAWAPLYNKYLQIAKANFTDRSSPGFNDQAVVPPSDDGQSSEGPWGYFDGLFTYFATPNTDLRDWVNNIELTTIASTFALAEFVITQNLASAYEMNLLQPTGLAANVIRTAGKPSYAPNTMNLQFVYDQHVTGAAAGLYLNSSFYRMLAGNILELVNQLKSAGMFNNTVIHLNQDFGRSPRNTGGGADHGFDSMIASVFTGMQTGGPLVLGNILSQGSGGYFGSNYSGCYGYKAPTSISGTSTLLTPAHVAASLAALLGLPKNPWANTASPLLQVSGGAASALAEGKVVPA